MMNNIDELVAKVRQGNPTATYDLLYKVYKHDLTKIIAKIKKCSDDIQIELILSDFYFFLLTPTKKDNRYRLNQLNANSNIESYLNNTLRNWLMEQLREEQRIQKRTQPIPENIDDNNAPAEGHVDSKPYSEENLFSSADDETDIIKKKEVEKKIWAVIIALESLPNYKTKDRYILLTYIMGERYKGMGGPLHISRYLSYQLDMTEAAIKMRYKRSLERLREEVNKNL